MYILIINKTLLHLWQKNVKRLGGCIVLSAIQSELLVDLLKLQGGISENHLLFVNFDSISGRSYFVLIVILMLWNKVLLNYVTYVKVISCLRVILYEFLSRNVILRVL